MKILFYILTSVGYLCVGLLWGYLRWKRYVEKELQFYDEERQKYLSLNRVRGIDIPDFLVFEWRNYVRGNDRLKAIPPKAIDFRGEITFDIVVWPIEMLITVVGVAYKFIWDRTLAEVNKVTNKKIDKIRKELDG